MHLLNHLKLYRILDDNDAKTSKEKQKSTKMNLTFMFPIKVVCEV